MVSGKEEEAMGKVCLRTTVQWITCKNIMEKCLPQPSSLDRHSLGLRAIISSVIPVSHDCPLEDMQQHDLLQGDLLWTSLSETT